MSRYHGSRHNDGLDHEEAVVRSYFHIPAILTDYKYHDSVSFSPDGQFFAVISESNDISIVKTDGCEIRSKIQNRKYHCSKGVFHLTKNLVYLNSKNDSTHEKDCAARLLNIEKEPAGFDRYFCGHTGQITSLAATHNGVITASIDRTIKWWSDSEERCISTIKCDWASNIALHPNGKCLAVASPSQILLYDLRNVSAGPVVSQRVSADSEIMPHFGMHGKYLVAVGKRFVRGYRLQDLSRCVALDDTDDSGIPGFSFTPDELFMLVPTNDHAILVADVKTGSQVTVLSGHDSPISSIACSSAYHNFVSTGRECLFWTVDMATYNSLYYGSASPP